MIKSLKESQADIEKAQAERIEKIQTERYEEMKKWIRIASASHALYCVSRFITLYRESKGGNPNAIQISAFCSTLSTHINANGGNKIPEDIDGFINKLIKQEAKK